MPRIQITRDSQDKPTKRCPFRCGKTGFAKVGGKFCTKECEYYSSYNPMTDVLECKNNV